MFLPSPLGFTLPCAGFPLPSPPLPLPTPLSLFFFLFTVVKDDETQKENQQRVLWWTSHVNACVSGGGGVRGLHRRCPAEAALRAGVPGRRQGRLRWRYDGAPTRLIQQLGEWGGRANIRDTQLAAPHSFYLGYRRAAALVLLPGQRTLHVWSLRVAAAADAQAKSPFFHCSCGRRGSRAVQQPPRWGADCCSSGAAKNDPRCKRLGHCTLRAVAPPGSAPDEDAGRCDGSDDGLHADAYVHDVLSMLSVLLPRQFPLPPLAGRWNENDTPCHHPVDAQFTTNRLCFLFSFYFICVYTVFLIISFFFFRPVHVPIAHVAALTPRCKLARVWVCVAPIMQTPFKVYSAGKTCMLWCAGESIHVCVRALAAGGGGRTVWSTDYFQPLLLGLPLFFFL